jgi:hypothetical protein
MSDRLVAGKVTVAPAQFVQVKYDAAEVAALVTDLAEQLGVSNPIELTIDETTPLSKIVSELDAVSSDAVIRIAAQSGALENTKVLTTLGPIQTKVAVGRMLLRTRDRMRNDFSDAPADDDLTREQNAAWDTYCAGRLLRAGFEINEQRWRYNHRNRFGFSDTVDSDFDRLWAADDLGWPDLFPDTS